MGIYYSYAPPKFKGLIAVWEDGSGKTIMVGSKEAYHWSISQETDTHSFSDFDVGWVRHIAGPSTITLEVTMPSMYMSTAEYIPNAPQIARKGIYLPNMTFLALEDKGE